ncbi:MAG: imidazoleglycerol-phosphate dehydratase HisB [Deltaproteobacteria bacterium]|nr:imidazoleglycerol-phosphate dehydratase HisB [Deltaproteobacteria bacterium]
MARTACVERQTAETSIFLELELDGSGKTDIRTPVPFFNHMLAQLACHGLFDLHLEATGDVEVDAHHTVEDTGIALGEAFRQALGNKEGIRRYGDRLLPMDEALVSVVVDFSGRSCLVFVADLPKAHLGTFDVELTKEFFTAFARQAGVTLHIRVLYGENLHHIVEAIFKAFGRALDEATSLDPRVVGAPSTKGQL